MNCGVGYITKFCCGFKFFSRSILRFRQPQAASLSILFYIGVKLHRKMTENHSSYGLEDTIRQFISFSSVAEMQTSAVLAH